MFVERYLNVAQWSVEIEYFGPGPSSAAKCTSAADEGPQS